MAVSEAVEGPAAPVARWPGWWQRARRVVERGVLWLLLCFYLVLHVAGVIEAERAMAVTGMLGMAVTALALRVVARH